MNRRMAVNRELEQTLAANNLLLSPMETNPVRNETSSPPPFISDTTYQMPPQVSYQEKQLARHTTPVHQVVQTPFFQENTISQQATAVHHFDPWKEIELLRKQLDIKSSEVEVLKTNSAAQYTQNMEMLDTFRTMFQEEIDKNNVALENKLKAQLHDSFEKLKTELSGGGKRHCKLTRRCKEYVQAWVNTLSDDAISEFT